MSGTNKAIFLSYARDDAAAARRIAEALRASGLEVWFDENELRGGDSWDAKIRKQIDECALFIPIVSQHTQERTKGYFRLEWKLAVDQTHLLAAGVPFIAPVVIDDTKESAAVVPPEFMRVQWTRLAGGLPTTQFVEQVKRLLEAPQKTVGRDRLIPPSARGSEDVRGGVSDPALQKKRSIPGWTWGALTAVVIGIAVALFTTRPKSPEPLNVGHSALSVERSAAPVAAAKSIAVLPFANMSEDKDANAFFADGMHEDILTNLALVRDLKVVSRTSVMEYRSTTKKIRQIATELGVAYILEGSVRRAGSKVRVTGQLINAATDEHLWAKSYDRDITDIFAIQSELSQAIASALSAALSPQEKSLIEKRPTANLAAYDLYLKGRGWIMGTSDLTRAEAEAALAEAVQLDPNFAGAWALLSSVHGNAVQNEEDHTPERLAKAKTALDHAVRLAPGDPEVVLAQGDFYYRSYRDYARAMEHYQRLLVIQPNSALAYSRLGFIQRRQGHWTASLTNLQRAAQLDPRSQEMIGELAYTYTALRRYDEAKAAFQLAAKLAPTDLFVTSQPAISEFSARGSKAEMERWLADQKPAPADETKLLLIRRDWARSVGDYAQAVRIDREHPYLDPYDDVHWKQDILALVTLMGNGELSAARARAAQLLPNFTTLRTQQPANVYVCLGLALLHAVLEHKEEAIRWADKAVELLPESVDAKVGPSISYGRALVLALTGDKERTLAELARLLRTPNGVNVHNLRYEVCLLSLRGDPRFEALLSDPKNNAPIDDTK